MNALRNAGQVVRRLTVFLVIALLVAACFFLYYFKYVPANRQRLENQAFLILEQTKNGIDQNNSDLFKYFHSKKSVDLKNYTKETRLDIEEPFHFSFQLRHQIDKNPKNDSSISFNPEEGRNINYSFSRKIGNSLIYGVPLNIFFDKILFSEKEEFFQSYFVVCQKDSKTKTVEVPYVLYSTRDLPVSEQVHNDSTRKKFTNLQFPGISDIEINGSSYKAFMIPLQIDRNDLILAGIMPKKDYDKRLQSLPFNSVSYIIIAFILILISIPYLKIFLIGRREHIGFRDLVFLGLTMFIGTPVFFIILNHFILQNTAQVRTEKELEKLANSISDSLRNEITGAYNELIRIDTRMKGENCGISDLNPCDFPKFISNTDHISYTGIQWIDITGQQQKKIILDNSEFQLLNVNKREYYQNFKDGQFHSFNFPMDSFVIAPVYSMSTNAFEVAIAKKSMEDYFMVAMAARLQSVMNTILPEDYGFCIINNDGLIQFKSEGTVTLQENFLAWINEKQHLSELIYDRQSRYISLEYINNKECSIYFLPIKNLPWYLAVYHQNDQSTNSILHITTFSLLFLFLVYPLTFLLCYFGWQRSIGPSVLYQNVLQFDWLKPGSNKRIFVSNANAYLLTFILFSLPFSIINFNNSVSWLIAMVSPIIVIWQLYIFAETSDLFNKRSLHGIPINAVKVFNHLFTKSFSLIPLLFLLILNLIYWELEKNMDERIISLAYEVIALVVIPQAALIIKRPWKRVKAIGSFNWNNYFFFWFLCIWAVSILPVLSLTQYAERKEIQLMMKNSQLDLAQKIDQRLNSYEWLKKVQKNRSLSDEKVDSLMLFSGIYSVFPLKLNYSDKNSLTHEASSTDSYDTIISMTGWNYHQLDERLPVQNKAQDGGWFWTRDKNKPETAQLLFSLSPENKVVRPEKSILSLQAFMPGVFLYYFNNSSRTLTLVLLIFVILLVAFYYLNKSVVSRIFLMDYFRERDVPITNEFLKEKITRLAPNLIPLYEKYNPKKSDPEKPDPVTMLNEIWENEIDFHEPVLAKEAPQILETAGEQIITTPVKIETKKSRRIEVLEANILYNQHYLSDVYEKLWNYCDDREKYFLYDLAKDGIMNYKTVPIAEGLIHKGLLRKAENCAGLRIMSVSFRNYILSMSETDEMLKLEQTYKVQGSWGKIRTPVLVVITAVGVFLFITQEDMIQEVGVIVPTLTGIFSLGSVIFGARSASAIK